MIVNIKKGYEEKITEIIEESFKNKIKVKLTVSQVVHQALDDFFENFSKDKNSQTPVKKAKTKEQLEWEEEERIMNENGVNDIIGVDK